ELTIGRAVLTTTVPSERRTYRDPFDIFGDVFGRGEEVVLRSSPMTINVKSLPMQGRPKDFTGSIGSFRISAEPNKTRVDVNQPVTVTIEINGSGNIKSIADPIIPESDDFRVYRASSNESVAKVNDRITGTKVYEEVFIPKTPGQLEIPAIAFNYFEPGRDTYKEIATPPIKLDVARPEGYVASPEAAYVAPDFTIGSETRDIRYIKENLGALKPVGQIVFRSPFYLAFNILPLVILAAAVVWRRRREKLAGDIGYARSRAALKMARRRLARARSMADTEKAAEFYAEIYLALTSFIADKMNISPHGLTTDRIGLVLGGKTAGPSLSEAITALMQKCDFARYAPSSVTGEDIAASLKQAEEIMVALEGVSFDD
ncbi:MAG: BatD family protein, partial [Candidatus Zixiibacteriota bacterium]